ncbi:hypothetical protein [Metapseudomonas otitidis]|uniref:Uncharacterized protein n=1 Tax=Metapseudomonas otitidis TaxID=319939 RepID=A0A679GN17_9GAMM|nr:hypothetical protein [Pseudomonas otitidis]BCA28660.1 hypothetical protein PtoMrB4_26370 [Pseudomonas otitidis]
MSRHRFLVSYIHDNQPGSVEVESTHAHLTPEQAHLQVQTLRGIDDPSRLSDIQVTPILHAKEPGTTPGHYQQP